MRATSHSLSGSSSERALELGLDLAGIVVLQDAGVLAHDLRQRRTGSSPRRRPDISPGARRRSRRNAGRVVVASSCRRRDLPSPASAIRKTNCGCGRGARLVEHAVEDAEFDLAPDERGWRTSACRSTPRIVIPPVTSHGRVIRALPLRRTGPIASYVATRLASERVISPTTDAARRRDRLQPAPPCSRRRPPESPRRRPGRHPAGRGRARC